MIYEPTTWLQRAIAATHHSAVLGGGARWHNPDYDGPADTVFGGIYRREVFERIGLFDEQFVRNQDDEFNLRLTRAGGTIWQSPKLKSWYTPRGSLGALFRQYRPVWLLEGIGHPKARNAGISAPSGSRLLRPARHCPVRFGVRITRRCSTAVAAAGGLCADDCFRVGIGRGRQHSDAHPPRLAGGRDLPCRLRPGISSWRGRRLDSPSSVGRVHYPHAYTVRLERPESGSAAGQSPHPGAKKAAVPHSALPDLSVLGFVFCSRARQLDRSRTNKEARDWTGPRFSTTWPTSRNGVDGPGSSCAAPRLTVSGI